MSQLFQGILQNAPIWVWPLFVVLVVIGFLSMKTRSSSVIPYFFYPLIGLAAIGAISGLAHVPLNWIAFAVGYLAGLALAFRWQDGLTLARDGMRVRLQGERITLLILMTIFFANFVNGVVEAVAPDLRFSSIYTIIFAGIVGACSGSFTGRALRVLTIKSR